MFKRITAAVVCAPLVLLAVTGCGKSGTTCSEFMAQDATTKKATMDAWGKDKGLALPGSILTAQMVEYCSDSSHSGDELQNLEFGM